MVAWSVGEEDADEPASWNSGLGDGYGVYSCTPKTTTGKGSDADLASVYMGMG